MVEPDAVSVACSFCGDPVAPGANGVYRKVDGWAENRSEGGTHALALARDLGEYAHGSCITAVRNGINPGQARLDV